MKELPVSLKEIAKQVPLGFECKSCGGSAYNWLMRIWRFQNTGEPCCADFKDWMQKAYSHSRPPSEQYVCSLCLGTGKVFHENPPRKDTPYSRCHCQASPVTRQELHQ